MEEKDTLSAVIDEMNKIDGLGRKLTREQVSRMSYSEIMEHFGLEFGDVTLNFGNPGFFKKFLTMRNLCQVTSKKRPEDDTAGPRITPP
jgi:hypothetical protein